MSSRWVPVRCYSNIRVGELVKLAWIPWSVFKEGRCERIRRKHLGVRLESGGYIDYNSLSYRGQPMAWRERRDQAS